MTTKSRNKLWKVHWSPWMNHWLITRSTQSNNTQTLSLPLFPIKAEKNQSINQQIQLVNETPSVKGRKCVNNDKMASGFGRVGEWESTQTIAHTQTTDVQVAISVVSAQASAEFSVTVLKLYTKFKMLLSTTGEMLKRHVRLTLVRKLSFHPKYTRQRVTVTSVCQQSSCRSLHFLIDKKRNSF